jgi:hypothetical protein
LRRRDKAGDQAGHETENAGEGKDRAIDGETECRPVLYRHQQSQRSSRQLCHRYRSDGTCKPEQARFRKEQPNQPSARRA